MAKYENYKSPIDACIYADDFSYKIGEMYDEAIMEAVLKVKVDVDKKELLKALEYDRGQYEMGYEQGYIDGKQKWIPVTERLPEKNGMYLVTYTGEEFGASVTGVRIEQFFTIDNTFFKPSYSAGAIKITAWQPLPEPYKEENK